MPVQKKFKLSNGISNGQPTSTTNLPEKQDNIGTKAMLRLTRRPTTKQNCDRNSQHHADEHYQININRDALSF